MTGPTNNCIVLISQQLATPKSSARPQTFTYSSRCVCVSCVFTEINGELKKKDDEFVKTLKRQAEDIDALLRYMSRQFVEMQNAYKEELDEIERAFLEVRETGTHTQTHTEHMRPRMMAEAQSAAQQDRILRADRQACNVEDVSVRVYVRRNDQTSSAAIARS